MSEKPAKPIGIFYSYSHKDEELRDELEKHLSILKRQGVITGWHDRRIGAGKEWKGEIDTHLNTAHVILLLISADFLASDYCYDVEMKRAMERHEAGEARVIPVILRPVDWEGAPFGKLQALPTDAKPVTEWPNRDKAFWDVARRIRAAVEELASPVAGLPLQLPHAIKDTEEGLNATLNRVARIHGEEIEVLRTAFPKLEEALGYVARFTAPLRYYPEFNGMTEQEINEFLEKGEPQLSNPHKKNLLEAPDKDQYYQKIIFQYELAEAKKHAGEFHNYLLYNRIFLSSDLYAQFEAMDKLLWEALRYRELGEASRDYKLICRGYEEIQRRAEPIREEIRRLVQKRLRPEEAE
jgi:hypothetical protein